ncbi:neutral zinc metallopeptidase [Kribbella speibonae]|uniref:Neutral zinc metallopeptidase n=1 Tax=Kribbella speibonae TaxID=1572660 RepID=A0A4R0IQQ2_9ACTN|nr:neutral zinc metallopeptidase [Kribbella speibonae]TCC35347.1 hypothetical protein E0H92_21560 [Kribbella speibonae]
MPDSEEGAPEPGHRASGQPAAGTRPLTLKTAQPGGLGPARSVSLDDAPLRRKARPLPTEPGTTSEYSGPPAAPQTGVPLTPLTGTRRVGGPRPTGWHSNPSRSGAQFTTEPPPAAPPRQYSRPIIVGLSILVILMLTGATIGGFKLVNSYGVERPLSQPSVKKSQAPLPVPPNPTVTVTATTVPDMVRLQKNELYKVGKVPVVNCKEPAIKLTNQAAVLRFYQAMLPCLNKAWGPLVKKAGYPFRSPKVTLVAGNVSSCIGNTTDSHYCGADETISMQWQDDFKTYKTNPSWARLLMMNTFAHEYGHHVQWLTNILISSDSREGWTNSKGAKLEWSRRLELQASCFGAAFLGANKQSLEIRGKKLDYYNYMAKHIGDENDPKSPPDHGSRASYWYWAGTAFKSGNPGSCNTYSAPSAKVS